MQTNLNCNCPKPQFGMAFRKPQNMDVFMDYAKMIKPANQKGFKQFVAEQAKLKHFDIAFDNETRDVHIIDKAKNKIINTFPECGDQTGFEEDLWGRISYPGRIFLGRFFNVKKNLPRNLYRAGEEAKSYEKMVDKQIGVKKSIDELF